MARTKVKLAFITNDASRKSTFRKRNKGLLKKVNELSTLCGISACAIIYSPYNTIPDVWPSNAGVQSVISEFRALPVLEQQKKMMDQETFLRQRIAKASEQFKKEKKESREREMTEVMFQCLDGNMGMFNLNIVDLNDLGYLIDQNLKEVYRRIEILGNAGMEVGESSNASGATAPSQGFGAALARTVHEVGSYSSSAGAAALFNSIQQQQQILRPGPPNVGLYEQPWNQNQNQQQRFVEMMNHPQNVSYAGEQMGFQFMGDNHQHSNHHHHPHHQPQQQQIPGDSSIAPAAVGTSSTNPVTGPNLTNNIWFP